MFWEYLSGERQVSRIEKCVSKFSSSAQQQARGIVREDRQGAALYGDYGGGRQTPLASQATLSAFPERLINSPARPGSSLEHTPRTSALSQSLAT
jgi:hypothetical protein